MHSMRISMPTKIFLFNAPIAPEGSVKKTHAPGANMTLNRPVCVNSSKSIENYSAQAPLVNCHES